MVTLIYKYSISSGVGIPPARKYSRFIPKLICHVSQVYPEKQDKDRGKEQFVQIKMFGSENEQGVVEEQELGSKIEIETVLFQFPHQDNSGKREQTEADHREGRETGEQVSVGEFLR